MDETVDRIRLTGIRARGHHGVLEHERRDGQTFVADVVLHVDTRPAAAADRLDLTVHYGEVAEDVAAVLAGPAADLVETVAERIAAVALGRDPVVAVDVVVHKPEAPITVPFADVTVEIHRSRTRPPAVGVHAGTQSGAPADGGTGDGEPDGEPGVVAPGRGRHAAPAGPATLPTGVPFVPPTVGEVLAADGTTAPAATAVPQEVAPAGPPDRMDEEPDGPVDAVLALGSNLGASEDTLRQVVVELAATDGVELTAVSPLVRTAAVGGPDQPDYLNAVVLARTVLSPRALLHACQRIEQRHGRERDVRWGPRTVDVDIVVHGGTVGVTDDLELPHPRAHERAFVLQPWAQVAPDAVLPGLGGGPVAALAETAPDRDGIRWMALDWWRDGTGG